MAARRSRLLCPSAAALRGPCIINGATSTGDSFDVQAWPEGSTALLAYCISSTPFFCLFVIFLPLIFSYSCLKFNIFTFSPLSPPPLYFLSFFALSFSFTPLSFFLFTISVTVLSFSLHFCVHFTFCLCLRLACVSVYERAREKETGCRAYPCMLNKLE